MAGINHPLEMVQAWHSECECDDVVKHCCTVVDNTTPHEPKHSSRTNNERNQMSDRIID